MNTRELRINFNNISTGNYSEGEGKLKGDWHAFRELREENPHGYRQYYAWRWAEGEEKLKTIKAKYITHKNIYFREIVRKI